MSSALSKVRRLQNSENIANQHIHKYIAQIIPYLEHRQYAAKQLRNYAGSHETQKSIQEMIDYDNQQIKDILNIHDNEQ